MIAGCDVDALVPPEQIIDTVEQVRTGNAVMGLAYDGRMLQTTVELVRRYQETRNFDVFKRAKDRLSPMYGDLSTGGVFIVDTEKYLLSGGENEYFPGWGCEDFERVKRMEILYPQPIYQAKGCLFHLYHPRGLNSWYIDSQYEINAKKEYLKVCGMTKDELRNYISSWPWLASLQSHSIIKL